MKRIFVGIGIVFTIIATYVAWDTSARRHESLREALRKIPLRESVDRGMVAKWFEPFGTISIAELDGFLKDLDPDVRIGASYALAFDGAAGIRALTEAMESESTKARVAAARGLGFAEKDAISAVPALKKAVENSDPSHRCAAFETLVRINREEAKKVLPNLIRLLEHENPGIQRDAAIAVREMGADASDAAPLLAKLVLSELKDVRDPAAFALAAIGPQAASFLPVLIEAKYRMPDSSIDRAISKVDPDGKARLAAVQKVFSHGDHAMRRQAAFELAMDHPETLRDEPATTVALQTLIEGLGQNQGRWDDGGIRVRSATALGRIGPKAKLAVGALILALSDADPVVRDAAAEALGSIGADAETTIPALAKIHAVDSLLKFGEPSYPVLTSMLKDPNWIVRRDAVRALGMAGSKHEAFAFRSLVSALKDRNVMADAIRSLIGLQLSAENRATAIPIFLDLLKSAEPKYFRADAARFLCIYRSDSPLILPALLQATHDPGRFIVGPDAATSTVGLEVKSQLLLIGPQLVPSLITALKHDNPLVKSAAAEVLGEMGEDPPGCSAALRAALKDVDTNVQEAATKALKRIENAVRAKKN